MLGEIKTPSGDIHRSCDLKCLPRGDRERQQKQDQGLAFGSLPQDLFGATQVNHRARKVGQVLVIVLTQLKSQTGVSAACLFTQRELLKKVNRLFALADTSLPVYSDQHPSDSYPDQKPRSDQLVAQVLRQFQTGFVLRDSLLECGDVFGSPAGAQ